MSSQNVLHFSSFQPAMKGKLDQRSSQKTAKRNAHYYWAAVVVEGIPSPWTILVQKLKKDFWGFFLPELQCENNLNNLI